MRKFYFSAAMVGLLFATPASAETLTNEQIVRMAAAGLGDQVLIAKIKASDNKFDTSTDGLLALRKKGVSNAVIAAMIAADAAAPGTAAVAFRPAEPVVPVRTLSADSPDPNVPHPLGIYLLADWRSPTRMVAIEPVTSERTKSGNLVAYLLTGGLAKRSRKALIHDAEARVRTPRRRPIFFFFLRDGRSAEQGQGAFWNAGSAVSPGDFSLIRFDVDKDARKVKIGSSNIMGSRSGVTEKARIPFISLQVSPGVYSVQPENALENGEYGFLYSPSTDGAGQGQRVRIFDFSVGE